jgi:hypothetical protein
MITGQHDPMLLHVAQDLNIQGKQLLKKNNEVANERPNTEDEEERKRW